MLPRGESKPALSSRQIPISQGEAYQTEIGHRGHKRRESVVWSGEQLGEVLAGMLSLAASMLQTSQDKRGRSQQVLIDTLLTEIRGIWFDQIHSLRGIVLNSRQIIPLQ